MKKQKHVLLKFLKIAFKADRSYFLILIISAIISSIQAIFAAYTISLIINYLELGNYNNALIAAFVIVCVLIVLQVLVNLMDKYLTVAKTKMLESINHTIAEKILSLPFEYLEDPYYMELKKDAQMGINNMGAIHTLFESFSTILSSIITIIGLGAIIASFDKTLIFVLLGGIVIMGIIIMLSLKMQVKFYKSILPINYTYNYYLGLLQSPTQNKELRLYSIYDIMYDNFSEKGRSVSKIFRNMTLKGGLYLNSISFIRYILMGFVYCFVAIKTIANKLSISSFSLTVSAAISFSVSVTSILNSVKEYIRSIEYIKPLVEIMSIKDVNNDKTLKLNNIETLEFKNVSFNYPRNDKVILDNISFKVNKNEKISIVGLNGAGKTTIVKLICRLYKPTKGQILINNIDIYEYEMSSYISKISTVFQDFKIFAYSIKENIRPDVSLEEARNICKDVNIDDKIESLKYKYDSILKKGFDVKSTDLSGGQLQKIAIARSLAKNADVLILDEPTSALDPLAEAEIYSNFNKLSENRTALYISHRMSSSIFCDKILVLNNGKVEDFDNHLNLMKKTESLYYKLFTTQAKNYKIQN